MLNASAGSGKTYHLVKEYIRLLIIDGAGSTAFAHIIAMTFTNKAALEMKVRILHALDAIGSPELSHPLTAELAGELAISEVEVEERCQKVLHGILHRYEEFHVMTIDKFNLKLIKSFGRDLDLPHDFEVTLDESELIERIVDELLNKLGSLESKGLNRLILAYAKSNIDDGKQWNFRSSLIDFGKILSSEKNHAIVERLLKMDFSPENYGLLRKEKDELDQSFVGLAEKLATEIRNQGLDADLLPGKSVTYKKIQSLAAAESFVAETPLLSDSFLKYMEADLKVGQEFSSSMKAIIHEMNAFHAEKVIGYTTLELFMKHFFNMALLQHMAEALKNVRQTEQIIRISEFNTLISQLIQHESTPFIYERLGTKFQHFLLDEFQDTSRLQWLNMVPFVRESMSQNKDNLIVGDPKQSIYRFKNGVAEQFVALPAIYNPENDLHTNEQSAYFQIMGEVHELTNNWRSAPAIVHFNTFFFQELRTKLPQEVANFYNAIEQTPQSSLKGRIHIVSVEGRKTPDELLPQIIAWTEECLAAGYRPGDLCILGNRNKECNRWALGLTDAGYKVVSSESLLIHNNLRVQLAIAFLRRRLRPNGENEIKRFAELYFRLRSGSYKDYKAYFEDRETAEGKRYRIFNDARFLIEHFEGEDAFFFKHESIYDLIQRFYQLAGFTELKDPYLHHLADFAFEFGLHKGPDLKLFLSEYEAKKHKLAVQIPESSDALQIMTIHKSKGLEFPVVIVPTMNFSSDIKGNFLIDLEDFVVYKQPSKSEQISVLQELYTKEREQIIADNMNKCYVAMTRPIERLYVANNYDKSGFGALFHQALAQHPLSVLNSEVLHLDIDEGSNLHATSSHKRGESFVPKDIHDYLWFPHIALQDRAELYDEAFLSEEMQYGLEFHQLAASIRRKEEIKDAVETGISEGSISSLNGENLQRDLHELFKNQTYLELLEGARDILSEQSIIGSKGVLHRPDKIILKDDETLILDFKTGLPNAKHETQIRQYKKSLIEMGYPKVRAFLFYTALQKLAEIS